MKDCQLSFFPKQFTVGVLSLLLWTVVLLLSSFCPLAPLANVVPSSCPLGILLMFSKQFKKLKNMAGHDNWGRAVGFLVQLMSWSLCPACPRF